MDGILSQEEINALLNNKEALGISEDEGDGSGLSDIEKDAIGEIFYLTGQKHQEIFVGRIV